MRSVIAISLVLSLLGCGRNAVIHPSQDGLTVDPVTGIPYALTFQYPVVGFDASNFGFGFGAVNTAFCKTRDVKGECLSYGYHLGRDALVAGTPVGTEVVAPADGIVRITTNNSFSGFGSDDPNNPAYQGCVIVLEHLLQNQQPITTLLGHVRCESGMAYSAASRRGNPSVGSIVRRGQYVAHVAHYWHGADQSTDWHHVHWGIRRGRFSASNTAALAPYVLGYAARSEFTTDPATGSLIHPLWMDPFIIVAANSDPSMQANTNVQHHPSGTLLQDPDGGYWFVISDDSIASISSGVLLGDRFDPSTAVQVTHQEVACYRHAAAVTALGPATLYVRPGTSTVVVAYASRRERYDFIRWESLLSWGFTDGDIRRPADVSTMEAYASRGFRLLRPGTLVKANDASEVAIVTAQQTRLPIVSGDVFEQAGFRWEHIVSLPASVLDQVAGLRETRTLTMDDLRRCAVPPACPGGAAFCGGGGPVDSDPIPPSGSGGASGGIVLVCAPGDSQGCSCTDGRPGAKVCKSDGSDFGSCTCTGPLPSTGGASVSTSLHLSYRSPIAGPLSIEGWWEAPSGTRPWNAIPCADANMSDDLLECDLPVPSGSSPFVFQVTAPGPKYWGDHSCDSGGCNKPLGSLTLTKGGIAVPYTFLLNGSGPLYYNGQVSVVP